MAKREVLIPVEREDIPFHGHTITAVKLPDNQIAVVLSWVCEALCVDTRGQSQRIERTPSIADELVMVKVLAKRGGMQDMVALTLRGFPTWILGIQPGDLKNDNPEEAERIRQMIIAYQVEAVDVLYNHFSQKSRLALSESQAIVPAEPVKPTAPQPDAPDNDWITYYQQMIQWHQWKQDMEVWRNETEQWKGSIESRQSKTETRVDSLEQAVRVMLPHAALSTAHKDTAKVMVAEICRLSGAHPGAVWSDLNQAFHVKTYTDIPDKQWAKVQQWLKRRQDTARQGRPSLFPEPNEGEGEP